ncbi:PPE family protein [Mycobacterium sp. E3198]|uniref:PPE family protein n=1 Tax=Mycobacterium sp. E3198 TaxID=1834143 RepID=UPI0007FE706A|nr:PPE family protein [Mycobacterium sp. E3198]OBG31132.1 hypothetical protein A5673_27460 [Mycobacterium sp. E3198]
MVDFAQLPPEINSALIYSGPGAGSILAAVAAWDGLATELQTAASAYQSLITGLTDGPWQGPAAAAMATAATRQTTWLSNTASKAQTAATQAVAAASAYDAAFLATVPPAEVAANRGLLMALLATNLLGQNTAAIAATEAQYAEMWAQDAAAMYGYAGSAAAATTLPEFTPAAAATSLTGLGAQGAAVFDAIQGAATAQGLYQVPKALSQLAGITNEPPWATNLLAAVGLTGHTWNANGDGLVVNGMLGDVVEGITGSATVDGSTLADAYIRMVNPARLTVTQMKDYFGLAHDLPKWASESAEAAAKAAKDLPAALPAALPHAGGLGGVVAAAGNGAKIGTLSAPASWASSVPAPTPAAVALNGLSAGASVEPATSALGGLPLLGGGGGRGMAHFAAPRYGFKPTVLPQPSAGG